MDRIKFEIELISEGKYGTIGDLGIHYDKTENMVNVRMDSNWSVDATSFTKQMIDNEILDMKRIFNKLKLKYADLNNFLNGKNVRFILMDDYGMGAVELAKEFDGETEYIVKIEK